MPYKVIESPALGLESGGNPNLQVRIPTHVGICRDSRNGTPAAEGLVLFLVLFWFTFDFKEMLWMSYVFSHQACSRTWTVVTLFQKKMLIGCILEIT